MSHLISMDFFTDGGWDLGEDDLELPPELEATPVGDDSFVMPPRGTATTSVWTNSSPLVVDHVLAGSFGTAFKALQTQVNCKN